MSQKRVKTNCIPSDRRLIPRINQYLTDNPDLKYVDVAEMAENLQNIYPEYGRKKKNTFKTCVAQAYEGISKTDESVAEVQQLKKRRKDGFYIDKDGADFSDDNPNYVSYKDKNIVNKTLTTLYGTPLKGNSPAVSDSENTPSKLKNEISSNVEVPAKTKRKIETEKTKTKKKEILVQESTFSFADIGGNDECLQEVCKLLAHMRHPEVYERLGVTPPRGFLLHGPPGCGKTLLAHAVAGELKLPFIKVAATEIVSGVSGESEEKIRELFDKAVASAPCILFIDEIDAITPKRETAQREMERRIVSQLLMCMDDLNRKETGCQVFVIGATNRPDSLDPALRRAGRFDREISMGIPDLKARSRILKVLCKNLKLRPDFDFDALSLETPGYVGADLMALAREAAMHAVNRVFQDLQQDVGSSTKTEESSATLQKLLTWFQEKAPLDEEQLEKLYIEMEDFTTSLKLVQPSALREGFATIPNVTWKDVGALQDVREELQMCILAPVKHAKEFDLAGLSGSAGVLLCGPPGCGKTLLAKAVANESGINFISVKGPELLNMYVGESERAVRQCFLRARNSAPCVIFFDELDALCPRRSHSSDNGSSVRVVNQLLTEMDGLESRKQVFIMGATNRPDIIDPAMMRPGRLDKVLYVSLPTSAEREDILRTITKNGTKPPLAADVDLVAISNDCKADGFTGADLTALVREASVGALKKFLKKNPDGNTGEAMSVTADDFHAAFLKVKPSVSMKDRKFYEKMQVKSVLWSSKEPSDSSNHMEDLSEK